MAATPTNNMATLTGATAVTLVADPGASAQCLVTEGKAFNLDSVAHTFTTELVNGANRYTLQVSDSVAASGSWPLPIQDVALTNGWTIEISIEGAHTTTAPKASASYIATP